MNRKGMGGILIVLLILVVGYIFIYNPDILKNGATKDCYKNLNTADPLTSFCTCMEGKLVIIEQEELCNIDNKLYTKQEYFCLKNPEETTYVDCKATFQEKCKSEGGLWNPCGNKCVIDNQGLLNIICPMVCEEICECGGIRGFKCPSGYTCKIPSNYKCGENKCQIADAIGYCFPERAI